MDRQAEGRQLIARIWFEWFRFKQRTGRIPTHVTLCRQDIWRVWIGLSDEDGKFKAEQTIFGMEINLLDEIPEGVVVVS